MIKIEVTTVVNSTEDVSIVKRAINNVFVAVKIEDFVSDEKHGIKAIGNLRSLLPLHDLLRKQKVLDATRKDLEKNKSEDGLETYLMISKQVATIGKINLSDFSEPLGPIIIKVMSSVKEEVEHLIDWLAPMTDNGVPVTEISIDEIET
ncbi:RNA-binding domain-containing protein [Methanosalsum natronophilum]|uniref:RNA-binding domain-containing protein n=1 Tax=Methanosalsum natronophilum TaxID=768733 RepID=UPI002168CF64|nr:RNA-binding domain-containing protein [Methanosalsum natronophilum]MCS3923959.1 putative RNA binding protein with dsRBD fold (UPF0201 family) [Methanosalsum natronophilum]